jgi:hypothetical protein
MSSASGSSMAKKPSKALGHWYRAGFALLMWIGLVLAPARAPASFVRNRNSLPIMVGLCMLTTAFTLFTIVLWLADHRKAK